MFADILAGNPHADRPRTGRVYFYSEPDKGGARIVLRVHCSPNAIEASPDEKQRIAGDVQKLLLDGPRLRRTRRMPPLSPAHSLNGPLFLHLA